MAAATDPQRHLLSLIRDFATEKSQGERRVVNLKNRIQQLRSDLDAANAELENSKRLKEMEEQDVKGYEVQLAMNDASIQALEARITLIQDEISSVGSHVDALKSKEGDLRDEFISQMLEFKTKIRQFQNSMASSIQKGLRIQTSLENYDHKGEKEAEIVSLEKEISSVISQIETEEREFEGEKYLHNQLQQDLVDSEKRLNLIKSIMEDMIELQDLTKYIEPQVGEKIRDACRLDKIFCSLENQDVEVAARHATELEERCAAITEELQRKCICPSCHLDNAEALGGLIEEKEDN